MTATRPNVLVFMADQMSPLFLPFHGHPVVQAPHMRALADEGVVFERAYCNVPLCAPARYAFMSGRLPSRIGGFDNAADFPADAPTFAHALRRSGYRTILSGKMHFCGADQLHGFEERLHDRHLPFRLRLGAELGCAVRAPGVVPQHVERAGGRPLRPHEPARLRRRGRPRGPNASSTRWCGGGTSGRSS